MKIFNLAEELEKERKKNKELEERIKIATEYINDIKNYMSIIGDATKVEQLQDRIDKATEYFYQLEDKGEYIHTDYIYEMIKILKGSDK